MEHIFPVRLALQDMAVVRAHRSVLEQSEPHVGPVVLIALLLEKCLQSDVPAVQRFRVCRPALPDAGVAVGGSDVGIGEYRGLPRASEIPRVLWFGRWECDAVSDVEEFDARRDFRLDSIPS